MNAADDAPGLLEALEVSDFVFEMRVERARAEAPGRSRSQAIALLNTEDALRELGIGRPIRWPRHKPA